MQQDEHMRGSRIAAAAVSSHESASRLRAMTRYLMYQERAAALGPWYPCQSEGGLGFQVIT
jgi:hypothetical protein